MVVVVVVHAILEPYHNFYKMSNGRDYCIGL